jgi:5'-3' exonuclease
MPPFPEEVEEQRGWEDALLNEVCKTVNEVWATAGKPGQVLIAVDGVVPMAKIRQQRVRRFKSAWLRGNTAIAAWDSNAITPGTEFMDRLTVALNSLAKEHCGWIVSGVREQGEGEHKIMQWLRKEKLSDPVIIYGLDADLIVLSMLVSEEIGIPLWLLREKQEFSVIETVSPIQEYSFMNISELKAKLFISGYSMVLNYVALMSLMGNDFLPHSLTHKLADDGHELVLRELRSMTPRWQLVNEGELQVSVLKDIVLRWASEEDMRMMQMIQKKRKPGRPVDDPMESLPLEWNIEAELMSGRDLHVGWRKAYYRWMHPSVDIQHVCQEYIYGCQWILDYYRGKSSINVNWMFPYWIPPLWSDLSRYSGTIEVHTDTNAPPTPEEQLTMVLPLSSWGLIRDVKLKKAPILSPQLWPCSFTFFSAGRKWLWECEARIPVVTAGRLRELLMKVK